MANFGSARSTRRSKAAMRAVAIGGLAVLLAGCYQTQEKVELYPNDYRLRHPITLRDGQQSVEVFLGRSRGGLSPEQRADVMSFAGNWKRQATSGILVEVPNDRSTKRAANDSLREIHSILNANGVPRGETPAYQARRSVAIDKYRKGENPSGSYPTDGSHGYDSSKLSDVGK